MKCPRAAPHAEHNGSEALGPRTLLGGAHRRLRLACFLLVLLTIRVSSRLNALSRNKITDDRRPPEAPEELRQNASRVGACLSNGLGERARREHRRTHELNGAFLTKRIDADKLKGFVDSVKANP